MSSAKNAPSSTSVNFGTSNAVEISVSLPIFAPRMRSHQGVSWLA
ncbi:Uncharacterised protein [Mycobacteroides abscessus subsp. abscessus]|nr:Uncharacterised protein [Mycobacteroides abscessus subsp. abscessus]SIK19074.1 Uncharacterised protein [Mycobacteroides abscessus subsp. abscessus]